jgi:hypothetical protein
MNTARENFKISLVPPLIYEVGLREETQPTKSTIREEYLLRII